jgi:GNAT superfamily N-acetyltransferase
VGVAAYSLHDPSQRRVTEALRQLPGMLWFSVANVSSLPGLARYASDLMRHDPAQPHWHVGPVAVDAPLQRKGIGTQLMAALCQRLDDSDLPAHLETEQAVNVVFYEAFGFLTVEEGNVIGLRHWFMRREPRAGG